MFGTEPFTFGAEVVGSKEPEQYPLRYQTSVAMIYHFLQVIKNSRAILVFVWQN